MRRMITPRGGQFLSIWVGYIIVAILFRTMTSQAEITSPQFLLDVVVGFIIAALIDLFARRRRPPRPSGKRRRR